MILTPLRIDKRIDSVHTITMTTTPAQDLTAAIETATANIKKATRLGLSNMAQDIRRERKAMTAKLEGLSA